MGEGNSQKGPRLVVVVDVMAVAVAVVVVVVVIVFKRCDGGIDDGSRAFVT